jgi:hypothetical protein
MWTCLADRLDDSADQAVARGRTNRESRSDCCTVHKLQHLDLNRTRSSDNKDVNATCLNQVVGRLRVRGEQTEIAWVKFSCAGNALPNACRGVHIEPPVTW